MVYRVHSNFYEILQILGVIHFISGSQIYKSITSNLFVPQLLLYPITPKSCIGG